MLMKNMRKIQMYVFYVIAINQQKCAQYGCIYEN